MSGRTLRRIGIAAALAVLAFGAWLLWGSPDLASRVDRDALETLVAEAGAAGPALVIGLMTRAVVASPIPSAPIALASGAAYGHTWGTIRVVLGAELGALVAFGLARFLGHDAIRRRTGPGIDRGLAGSQNALTAIVLVSRLLPFVSFDAVSYAARAAGSQRDLLREMSSCATLYTRHGPRTPGSRRRGPIRVGRAQ